MYYVRINEYEPSMNSDALHNLRMELESFNFKCFQVTNTQIGFEPIGGFELFKTIVSRFAEENHYNVESVSHCCCPRTGLFTAHA